MLNFIGGMLLTLFIIPVVLWDSYLICNMWDWFVKPHTEFSLKFSVPVFILYAYSFMTMTGEKPTRPTIEIIERAVRAQIYGLALYFVAYVTKLIIM